MADEISVTSVVTVANGDYSYTKTYSNKTLTQTTAGGHGPGTEVVGLVEETKDMSAYSVVTLHNRDTTNYVQVGFATGVYNLRLHPGGPPITLVLEASQTLYLLANTAACEVDIFGQFI